MNEIPAYEGYIALYKGQETSAVGPRDHMLRHSSRWVSIRCCTCEWTHPKRQDGRISSQALLGCSTQYDSNINGVPEVRSTTQVGS
eukprot:scaffold113482_cov33-Prasinocladus_malaysianus.AAC.1